MEAAALLDAVKVEEADVEQKSGVAHRHNHKWDSTDVLHLPIELEIAFPSQNLVTPLHHSARGGRR